MVSRCRRQLGWAVALILGTALFAAQVANAATVWRASWRVEGYVGQAPADVKPEAHVVFQYNGQDYAFDLTKTVLTHGHVRPGQLLDDIQHHRGKLLLRGKAKVLDGLKTASPGEMLLIFAEHDGGSRNLQVTKISAASPNSVPAAK